ncbi:MAG: methionyl-tRNA formyltransferase [Rhodothermales bacterium]|nr:methionyl-tRNA formyltransferase [Rhodothermales bacterium]
MKIIFMGTAEFAVPSLKTLCENDYRPIAVVTGPDKPRGRGRRVKMTPVKTAALQLGIPTILQPESVKSDEFADAIKRLSADLIIVVAFRILPPAVYEAAILGAVNLHGSLLPAYRGAAPIHHAVLNGDEQTGVTTFFIKQKVDTGDIILKREMSIGQNETTGDVHDKMMILGADAVLDSVRLIEGGKVEANIQDDSAASPAPKVYREKALIDWDLPSGNVHNHIRGYSPVPGAWTTFNGQVLRLLRSRQAEGEGDAGTVLQSDGSLVVACATGAVEIVELQLEGRKRLPARDFLNGVEIPVGYRFT